MRVQLNDNGKKVFQKSDIPLEEDYEVLLSTQGGPRDWYLVRVTKEFYDTKALFRLDYGEKVIYQVPDFSYQLNKSVSCPSAWIHHENVNFISFETNQLAAKHVLKK